MINDEIKDAVGELTNMISMISGQARKELEDIARLFDGSIPSVVSGKNHELLPMSKGFRIAIPFKTDFGSFTIEVALGR